MKTMLVVFVLTIVFVVSMTFIESKRQESLNRINLEYQEGIAAIGGNITPIIEDKEDDGALGFDDEDDMQVITINLEGEVNNPGSYECNIDSYLYEIIEFADGVTSKADSSCFNLYYRLTKNETIYIAPKSDEEKLSINNGTVEDFDNLPGIGVTIANRIIEYRNEKGDFQTLDQLKSVNGVGNSLFNKIKDIIKL